MSTGVDAQVMASSRPEADVEGAEWTWQCLGPVIDGRALIVRFSPNGKRALVRGVREGSRGECGVQQGEWERVEEGWWRVRDGGRSVVTEG